MSRRVPFFKDEICDECGATGAYDFMGDCYCQNCVNEIFSKQPSEEKNNDSELVEAAFKITANSITTEVNKNV